MRTFKVFHQAGGRVILVKQGWSWPGFFFVNLWALCNRMWLLGFGLTLLMMFTSAVLEVMRQAGLNTLVFELLDSLNGRHLYR